MPQKISIFERHQMILSTGVDLVNRTIYLFGPIDEEAAYRSVVALRLLDETRGDISIIMNTAGGSIHDGQAIVDAISLSHAPIAVTGTGTVMSMGVMIMQAADGRFVTPSTTLMVHDGSIEASSHVSEFLSAAKEVERVLERDIQILAKRTGKTVEEITKMSASTTHFTAQQALEAGLIDGIITTTSVTKPRIKKKKKVAQK